MFDLRSKLICQHQTMEPVRPVGQVIVYTTRTVKEAKRFTNAASVLSRLQNRPKKNFKLNGMRYSYQTTHSFLHDTPKLAGFA